LRYVVGTIRDAPVDTHERLLRQAEISYLADPDRFANISGRLSLLEVWDSLLVEASEKLAADRKRADAYAAGDDGWDDRSPVAVASRAALRSPDKQ
jgi:hypothetical protein